MSKDRGKLALVRKKSPSGCVPPVVLIAGPGLVTEKMGHVLWTFDNGTDIGDSTYGNRFTTMDVQ